MAFSIIFTYLDSDFLKILTNHFFVFSVASPRNERVEQARQVLQSEVVQEASENALLIMNGF